MLRIDRKKCNGCAHLKEGPRCVSICPGGLLFLDREGRSAIYNNSECWDCCSCVKECPRAALTITLPFQINESRTELLGRCGKETTRWDIRSYEGKLVKRFRVRSRDERKGEKK